jgi:hypothetical protein
MSCKEPSVSPTDKEDMGMKNPGMDARIWVKVVYAYQLGTIIASGLKRTRWRVEDLSNTAALL